MTENGRDQHQVSVKRRLTHCTKRVPVKRGFGVVVYLFLKNAVLGLGLGLFSVRVRASVSPDPNPNPKTALQ